MKEISQSNYRHTEVEIKLSELLTVLKPEQDKKDIKEIILTIQKSSDSQDFWELLTKTNIQSRLISLLEMPNNGTNSQGNKKANSTLLDLIYYFVINDQYSVTDICKIIKLLFKKRWETNSKIKILQMLFYFVRVDLSLEACYGVIGLIIDSFVIEDSSIDLVSRPIVCQIVEKIISKHLNTIKTRQEKGNVVLSSSNESLDLRNQMVLSEFESSSSLNSSFSHPENHPYKIFEYLYDEIVFKKNYFTSYILGIIVSYPDIGSLDEFHKFLKDDFVDLCYTVLKNGEMDHRAPIYESILNVKDKFDGKYVDAILSKFDEIYDIDPECSYLLKFVVYYVHMCSVGTLNDENNLNIKRPTNSNFANSISAILMKIVSNTSFTNENEKFLKKFLEIVNFLRPDFNLNEFVEKLFLKVSDAGSTTVCNDIFKHCVSYAIKYDLRDLFEFGIISGYRGPVSRSNAIILDQVDYMKTSWPIFFKNNSTFDFSFLENTGSSSFTLCHLEYFISGIPDNSDSLICDVFAKTKSRFVLCDEERDDQINLFVKIVCKSTNFDTLFDLILRFYSINSKGSAIPDPLNIIITKVYNVLVMWNNLNENIVQSPPEEKECLYQNKNLSDPVNSDKTDSFFALASNISKLNLTAVNKIDDAEIEKIIKELPIKLHDFISSLLKIISPEHCWDQIFILLNLEIAPLDNKTSLLLHICNCFLATLEIEHLKVFFNILKDTFNRYVSIKGPDFESDQTLLNLIYIFGDFAEYITKSKRSDPLWKDVLSFGIEYIDPNNNNSLNVFDYSAQESLGLTSETSVSVTPIVHTDTVGSSTVLNEKIVHDTTIFYENASEEFYIPPFKIELSLAVTNHIFRIFKSQYSQFNQKEKKFFEKILFNKIYLIKEKKTQLIALNELSDIPGVIDSIPTDLIEFLKEKICAGDTDISEKSFECLKAISLKVRSLVNSEKTYPDTLISDYTDENYLNRFKQNSLNFFNVSFLDSGDVVTSYENTNGSNKIFETSYSHLGSSMQAQNRNPTNALCTDLTRRIGLFNDLESIIISGDYLPDKNIILDSPLKHSLDLSKAHPFSRNSPRVLVKSSNRLKRNHIIPEHRYTITPESIASFPSNDQENSMANINNGNSNETLHNNTADNNRHTGISLTISLKNAFKFILEKCDPDKNHIISNIFLEIPFYTYDVNEIIILSNTLRKYIEIYDNYRNIAMDCFIKACGSSKQFSFCLQILSSWLTKDSKDTSLSLIDKIRENLNNKLEAMQGDIKQYGLRNFLDYALQFSKSDEFLGPVLNLICKCECPFDVYTLQKLLRFAGVFVTAQLTVAHSDQRELILLEFIDFVSNCVFSLGYGCSKGYKGTVESGTVLNSQGEDHVSIQDYSDPCSHDRLSNTFQPKTGLVARSRFPNLETDCKEYFLDLLEHIVFAQGLYFKLKKRCYCLLFDSYSFSSPLLKRALKNLFTSYFKNYLQCGIGVSRLHSAEVKFVLDILHKFSNTHLIGYLKDDLIDLVLVKDFDIISKVRDNLKILFKKDILPHS